MERRRNWKKWRSIAVLIVCASIAIVANQNCESTGEVEEMPISLDKTHPEEGRPVSVIDNIRKDTELRFASSSYQAHAEAATMVLEGRCSDKQDGAIFSWSASEEDGREVERGYAECESGRFAIEIPASALPECDLPLRVSAQLSLRGSAEASVSRRCPADQVADAGGLSHVAHDESRCVIESRGSSCSLACYTESGMLDSDRPLEAQSCPGPG